jgi:hypothetical protein
MRNPTTRLMLAAGAIGAMIALAGCQVPTATGSASTTPASTTSAQAAKQWTMPNLVGSNLQAAQDKMQSVTGDPIFLTSSHDASGRRRQQVVDRDWKVCTQNLVAGKTFTIKAKIDFGAVKVFENCP